MRRVLLICGAGMSSSMMAKKTTEYFQENGHDIEMTAVGVPEVLLLCFNVRQLIM